MTTTESCTVVTLETSYDYTSSLVEHERCWMYQVETFLKKLPRKYDKMRADWDNGRREYTGFNYPVTVAKAYKMAVRHVGFVAADVGNGRRISLPLEARGVLITK
jgi:hypothetical protein